MDTTLLRGLGRRGFLAGAGAVATSLSVAPDARAFSTTDLPPGPVVRRDVWSLGAPWNAYTEAYARAVRLMQQRAPTDPTSWYYQAAIHGGYVRPPLPGWNQCQHASWYFLPWHRMFVHFFERIVRVAVQEVGGPSDWAMPYWNYDSPFPGNTLPAAFRQPTLPDGSANPLYLRDKRSTAMMDGFQISARMASPSRAMASTVFAADPTMSKTSFGGGRRTPAQFGGAIGLLEQGPHNPIHTQVGSQSSPKCTGGWMSAVPCAANDPIFYLHHANIDRLWDVWLARGGGRSNPSESEWLNQSFTLFDEHGQPVAIRVSQVLDTFSQLGYSYA